MLRPRGRRRRGEKRKRRDTRWRGMTDWGVGMISSFYGTDMGELETKYT